MFSISKAINIIKRETPNLRTETIHISEIVGRVLAQDIFADMDLPPFDRSQMDGFAVRTADVKNAPVKLKIVGESVAGKGWHKELKNGQAVRIMTGASVPKGADSVQKVELATEDNGFVSIEQPTKIKQNIVKKAEEIKNGEMVFGKGDIVSENMVATLASFGYEKIKVYKRPKVLILSTGSEIVNISKKPGKDQIRNSNSWSLRAFAQNIADVEILPSAADDLEDLKKVISKAVKNCDCLIISGGVSVGDYDFTKPALKEIGAEVFFEKISLKPGKPTVFAKFKNTSIFGLPGNPVSSSVTFYIFVRMALMQMQSANKTELKTGFAKLKHKIKGARGRDSILPVSLSTNKTGALCVETLRFSGSSNFIRFAKANGLVFIPKDKTLETDAVAKIYFLSGI